MQGSGNWLANFFEGQIQTFDRQNILPRTNVYFWDVTGSGKTVLRGGFGAGYASQTTLNLSDTSPTGTLASATYNPASGFGFAPQKLGRRLMEVSAKYTF